MTAGEPKSYEWSYHSKETLTEKQFLRQLADTFQAKDIVSVGEAHDVNQDTSYSWMLPFKKDILRAYSDYSFLSEYKKDLTPRDDFARCLPRDSLLMQEMEGQSVGMQDLTAMHPGRLFAVGIVPLARLSGFKHLVLEGEIDSDPVSHLQRSKDQTGDLLRLSMAMLMGMRIKGGYSGGLFETPADIGQALYRSIIHIKQNEPQAKILTYNGAMHNMTIPFQGTMQVIPGFSFDLSQITYAPQLLKEWGDKYAAIDILGNRPLPESHFAQMRREAGRGITAFKHGIGQTSYVIK